MNETITPFFKKIDFDPFSGAEISQVVPMTASQTEIWLSCTLGGDEGNMAYNESNSLRLTGELDVSAFKTALMVLFQRHESLRCSFSGNGKNMVIYSDTFHSLIQKDLSALNEVDQSNAVRQHLAADASHLFDLVEGPLLKISLLKLSSQVHLFTLTAHHLVVDGWSIGLIMEELGEIYSAKVQGQNSVMPPPKSFSEYAEEQRQFFGSHSYEDNLKYWLNQFKDKTPVLNVPTSYDRPKTKTYASSRIDQVLEKSMVASLRHLAVSSNCTFVNAVMTAFEVYLSKLTGENEVVLGLPASGQAARGYYDLVGHCVNFLPMRSHVDHKLTFSDYLTERKNRIYDAYEHQELTFGTILKKLKIPRDSSRIPLVPVAFNVDFGMEDDVKFHGLEFEMISNPKAYLNFEIFLNINGSDQKVVLEWSYNKQLFDQTTMEKYVRGFDSWLRFLINNPDQKIGSFNLSDQNNSRMDKGSKSNFSPDFSTFRPVHQLIERAASFLPEKIAVFGSHQHYTYKELNKRANQLSQYLLSKGLKKGEIVAIIMDRSIDTIVAILGTLKAGAAYLPVDTDFPVGRVEYMLQDSASMHIIDRQYKNRFKSESKEIIFEEFAAEHDLFPHSNPNIDVSSRDAAYIIYTSGSTGRPKGVILEHGNLFNFLKVVDEKPGITHDDRFLAVSSISFDIAILEVLLPYVNGAQSYILDKDQRKDPETILDHIEFNGITHMFATPSHWRMLLDSNRWTSRFSQFNIISGGEALSLDLARKLLPLANSLWNIYGPTETTVYSTIKRITPQQEVITIGKPVHNTQIYILDANLRQVVPGEIGELFIAGDGVGRGYLNRPELTAESFLTDPNDPSGIQKMYKTGDLGKFTADGELIILGRVDFQVKIRGYRIELGEIEQALIRLNEVKDAVVLAKKGPNDNPKLVAFLVLKSPVSHERSLGQQVPHAQVQAWKNDLQHFLPSYMLPSEFIGISQFPLTTSGKTDRKALELTEIIYDTEVSSLSLAESSLEMLVAKIWEDALGISPIDINHDFFEIGGHSMIAVQVMTSLEEELKIKLPISILFEHPTIKRLARLIESKEDKASWKSLVPIKPAGSKTPLYIVHGGGLNVMPFYAIAKHLDAEQPLYGLQAIGLNGEDKPPHTIEGIASEYIKEITSQNPTGPYALAGYSLGGIIAFEMAKQLKSQGKEIKALVMFDTYAIRNYNKGSRSDRWINIIRTEWGKRLFDLKLLVSNPRLLKRIKKVSLQNKAGKIKRRLIAKDDDRPEILKVISKIKKIHIQAGNEYTVSHYDGDMYLFRAKIRTHYERDFKFFGWKPYVNKVHVIEMEGEHTTMFAPPNEKNFVRILQNILNDVDTEGK